jgi:hypothetical protein
LAFSTQILVPAGQTIWGFTLRQLMDGESPGPIIRLAALLAVFVWQLYRLLPPREVPALSKSP